MTAYRTILADPPWKYGDKLRQSSVRRSAEDQYDVMSVDEICTLGDHSVSGKSNDVAGHAIEDEAFLWLWVTNPFLLDGSGARVCKAWGFEPKQLVTWVKTKEKWVVMSAVSVDDEIRVNPARVDAELNRGEEVTPKEFAETLTGEALQMGMGRITRGVTEHMIVATRGKYTQHVRAKNRRNVLFSPRTKHSRKPVHQYDLIEAICPGPYLELFAREPRDGWTSWGNELVETAK